MLPWREELRLKAVIEVDKKVRRVLVEGHTLQTRT